jgi:hypothetical protein
MSVTSLQKALSLSFEGRLCATLAWGAARANAAALAKRKPVVRGRLRDRFRSGSRAAIRIPVEDV